MPKKDNDALKQLVNNKTNTGAQTLTPVEEPILVANGYNGSIHLYQNKVCIRRTGALSFMTHGLKGDKDIFIKNITAIQFKEPGPFLNGFVQIALSGSSENKSGLFDATKDENTVMINVNQVHVFRELNEEIEERMMVPASSRVISSADELEKFAKLRDQGVITGSEFEAKKKQMLGL